MLFSTLIIRFTIVTVFKNPVPASPPSWQYFILLQLTLFTSSFQETVSSVAHCRIIRTGHESVQEEGKAQTHQQRGSPSGGSWFCDNKQIFCFSLVNEVGWKGIRHLSSQTRKQVDFPLKKRCTKGITNKLANPHPIPMGEDNYHGTNRHPKVWAGTGQGWKQLRLSYAVDSFLQATMLVKLLLRRVRTHALTAQEFALQNSMGWGSQKASRGTPAKWPTPKWEE